MRGGAERIVDRFEDLDRAIGEICGGGVKKFWTEVTVEETADGYAVCLDTRPLRTPAKVPCLVPIFSLAEAIAAEWDAQGDQVDPRMMPLTRAANSTIDRVIPEAKAVGETIAAYGQSDLICYRASHPEGLVARQAAAWDPLVDWARTTLEAPLTLGEGVMHVAQPAQSIARLGAAVRAHSPWELTALHDLVTISGSLVVGLAVSQGRLGTTEAWSVSRIDEDWNIEKWGEDAEAAKTAQRRETDFKDAARLLGLVRS